MSTESGMVGGVPSALPSFGSATIRKPILSPHEMFDLISGGGLNMTCLGIGEVDGDGNNNVSRMGKRLTGHGGFIDITAATPKVIFAGTLMGKAKVKVGGGKLEIVEEGTIQKFVEKVGQITFSGQYAPDNQEVLYVTERAVFQLIDHKMTLIEIAPGIDLQKDVLDNLGFTPGHFSGLKGNGPGHLRGALGRIEGLSEIIEENDRRYERDCCGSPFWRCVREFLEHSVFAKERRKTAAASVHPGGSGPAGIILLFSGSVSEPCSGA